MYPKISKIRKTQNNKRLFIKNIGTVFLLLTLFLNTGCKSYIKTLKSYPDYYYESIDLKPFTYSCPSDTNLIKLKETYNLEQVAGDGNELSKIINLMFWVHNAVIYDGTSIYPGPRNSFDLIKFCKEEKKGINCRMVATLLNEVYLSMGFYSRFVTCMPEGEKFSDCHVINIVYSKTLNKWIYMDASACAYFKDKDGTYLSIEEVREHFINNKKIVINDEINYNGKKYFGLIKKAYPVYMKKNLFRFSCPVYSEFNYESSKKDKYYICLNPKNYEPYGASTFFTEYFNSINGYKRTKYYISNPEYFWSKPLELYASE